MEIIEVVKDLFTVDSKYYLVQCISADFGMGKGIAVEFNKRFNMKNQILEKYGHSYCEEEWLNLRENKCYGDCLLVDRVFNLITKTHYWEKPTLNSLKDALVKMRYYCLKYCIDYVAMPRIGCGLDKLYWPQVKDLLISVFNDMDINILVCIQDDKQRVESICSSMEGYW